MIFLAAEQGCLPLQKQAQNKYIGKTARKPTQCKNLRNFFENFTDIFTTK